MMPNPFTPPPEGAPSDVSATAADVGSTEKSAAALPNQPQEPVLKGESSTGARYCLGCDKQLWSAWSTLDRETGFCAGCRDAGTIADLRSENARLRALLGYDV